MALVQGARDDDTEDDVAQRAAAARWLSDGIGAVIGMVKGLARAAEADRG